MPTRRPLLVLAITAIFAATGCGRDDGNGGKGSDPVGDDSGVGPSDDTGISPPPGEGRWDLTLDPDLARRMTSSESAPLLNGLVLDLDGVGMPSKLEWAVTHDDGSTVSGSGTIDPAGTWSAQVTLNEGDNGVEVTVPGTETVLELTVTHNPGYAFGGLLALDQTVAYVGEARAIQATIILTDPATDPLAVSLVQVRTGKEIRLGVLVDDGDVTQGDEVSQDHVYNGRFDVVGSAEELLQFRVVVGTTSASLARSELREVFVTEHIDPKRFAAQVAAGADHRARLELAVTEKEKLDVLQQIHDELANDPTVLQVEFNDDGRGLWLVYDNGIAAVVAAPFADEMGAAGFAAPGSLAPTVSALPGAPSGAGAGCEHSEMLGAAPNENTIDGATVLILSPYSWYFGKSDSGPAIEKLFAEHGCASVISRLDETEGSGDVDDFKSMSGYGAVFIITHGQTYFQGLTTLQGNQFQWDGAFGTVILSTNDDADEGDLEDYEDDLKAGRLVLCYDGYCLAPSFIKHYAGGRMPSSLVYAATCKGTWNGTLAAAFLESGAKSFLGYSNIVRASFAYVTGVEFITTMLEPDATVADAFVPGQVDSYAGAEFTLLGSSDLEFDFEAVFGGDFESGFEAAWSPEGQAMAVPAFGEATPTQGSRMALLTSGLGEEETYDAGRMSQRLCLSEDDMTLTFDWNFFTDQIEDLPLEEKEMMDWFAVRLWTFDYGDYLGTVFFENTESLESDLTEVLDMSLTHPDEADGCDGEDTLPDCTYSTGWLTATVSLEGLHEPHHHNGGINLVFEINKTYSHWGLLEDTAVLIDNVRLGP